MHCLQLVTRLHAAGFAQNSMFVRNVLVQPGPLSAPRTVRSYKTPSFRLIDFGCGDGKEVCQHVEIFREDFARWCADDRAYVRRDLDLDHD